MAGAAAPVQVAVAAASRLGESPMWHPHEQVLYYCDIPGHRLNRFDPRSGELRHWQFDTDVSCVAPRLDGALLLAMRDGLWRFDASRNTRMPVAAPPYDPKIERFNDGKCDPMGRFWVGTIYEPRDSASASLHRLARGRLTRMLGDATVLNGLAWSPNGRTMHWSDTKSHTIYAADFDMAAGELSRSRVFARFPVRGADMALENYGGRPDGAAMDTQGCCWVAMFEGQRLVRLSPDGELLQELRLPVRCPTMPCFGGADLRTLYITTARENRPPLELLEQTFAGCVLSVEVDVPGLPVNFAL
jgi:sugar lactone lactonase YvrE